MTNSIEEISRADCIFVIGSNTTEAHPVIGLGIKEAVKRNGATLVVADPRQIDLTRFAVVHMRQRPGSDVALLNAMMWVIISEDLYDRDYVAERTEGFEAVRDSVAHCTPEWAEPITGVPADQIRESARAYAGADRASIIYSMGITQHRTGTDNVHSLANLAMLTGNVGRESTGVNPLRGQNNVQGACDLGALPNVYPGYQKVDQPDIRSKFEEAWGVPLSAAPGLTVMDMMHGAEDGSLRALYVMGENPAMSDPNLNRTRSALDAVEFLVVQDVFMTETAERADVVLPTLCFAEKDGTFTNTERRVQRVRKAVDGPGESRSDWTILCDVASAMGCPMQYDAAAAIMDEIASLSPIYGGISFERIEQVGLQWPCPDRDHPGTPYLHKGAFKRGKGKFHPIEFREPEELPDDEYPFTLTTGRQLYQFHTATMSRKSEAINQRAPAGYVEVHPDDAARLGIRCGDTVEVSSRRGTVKTVAQVTAASREGCLFMPFHFCEGPANMLTNDVLDPVAKIPELKVCAVALRTVSQPSE